MKKSEYLKNEIKNLFHSFKGLSLGEKWKFDKKLWTQVLRFILDHPINQWLAGIKSGEDGHTKIWISWEWKELFRWN